MYDKLEYDAKQI